VAAWISQRLRTGRLIDDDWSRLTNAIQQDATDAHLSSTRRRRSIARAARPSRRLSSASAASA
jgi:replicative DNA helicase